MITIIDDFLDKDDFEKLKTFYEGREVSWNYISTIVFDDQDGNLEEFQFVDLVYDNVTRKHNENLKEYFIPLLRKLNVKALIKLKVNLTTKKSEQIQSGDYHIDFDNTCKTAIFYINTNNGQTLFKNGVNVDSIANRVVIFDSKLLHTGTFTTDKKVRLVVNINYYDNMDGIADPKGEIVL